MVLVGRRQESGRRGTRRNPRRRILQARTKEGTRRRRRWSAAVPRFDLSAVKSTGLNFCAMETSWRETRVARPHWNSPFRNKSCGWPFRPAILDRRTAPEAGLTTRGFAPDQFSSVPPYAVGKRATGARLKCGNTGWTLRYYGFGRVAGRTSVDPGIPSDLTSDCRTDGTAKHIAR